MTHSSPESATALRRLAEEKAALSPQIPESLPPEEARRVLHELRVHQIELEMQNEELRRTQAELEASRELYFDLYNLAPVGYVTLSEQGLIREANLTAATMLGVTRIDLVRRPFSSFILPEFQDVWYRHRKQLFDTGEPQSCELRLLRRNAAPFWVRIQTAVAPDADGVPVCRTVVSDIAAGKQASQYARSLIEASLDPLVTISAEGKITDVNEGSIKATGVTREKLIGTDFSDYFTEPDQAREGYRQVFANGFVTDYPLTIRHTDGRLTDVLYNATVYRDSGGNVLGVFAAARDVTERKLLDEKLRKLNEELAHSNRELEQFAYVASHDLQEPLRMVASYTQLLERRYGGLLDQDARQFIGYAVDGATRMQRLIDDLLTLSRVGTKGQPPVPTDSRAVVDQALGNLQIALGESGAVVTVGDLPTVRADTIQLVQLFQNLVANAIKFSRSGEAPQIAISAENIGNEWRFAVRDNGIGIDPQYADKIFVIFQRLHTREEYPGTGIGLAVCKRIVERHGGRIWVESVVGQGATFFFTVPPPA
jgi:PAS domain S-box-containing protein